MPRQWTVAAWVCLVCGCSGDVTSGSRAAQRRWESRHHPIRVAYDGPWKMIEPYRVSQDSLLIGLIDEADGTSYIIKIDEDVPQESLSDYAFFMAIKDQMLTHAPDCRFVDESEVECHDATYWRLTFLFQNEQWKHLFCQTVYIRRTGEHSIACQLSYPIDDETQLTLPRRLYALDENIRLFENAN